MPANGNPDDLQQRLEEFVTFRHERLRGDEKGEAQVFLDRLFKALGYAGVFAVFTYIAPMLTRISGFGESAVSPILLIFGSGLVIGNLVGGRLADRNLLATIFTGYCQKNNRYAKLAK